MCVKCFVSSCSGTFVNIMTNVVVFFHLFNRQVSGKALTTPYNDLTSIHRNGLEVGGTKFKYFGIQKSYWHPEYYKLIKMFYCYVGKNIEYR